MSGVAGRYATALFELAQEAGNADAVGADLNRFAGLIEESDDLKRLIKSPVFTVAEQSAAIDAILARAGIGGLTANFLRLVAAKRRLFAVPSMVSAYRALLARAKGVTSAEVAVAEQPSEARLAEIKDAVRGVAGGDVDIKLKVDPALIGGLTVKIGSRMIDASLRTKLNSIRIAMKEVG